MAGLSDFITNTANQSTTMPQWYDTAQQNIVNRAGAAANQMPGLQNTVAGQAISNLSGPNNPFMQAQNTLGQIGSGAANPFFTNPTTGQVTPDTSTAMGGLFQAQNQQLNQLLPNYTAAPMAASIGSGQFGSLRGETAVDKARADAFAQLLPAQMQAALSNQATGVNAATGLGQVGSAGTTSMLGLGQAQQSDPFTAAANYGKIVGGIQAPLNVANRTQLSPLNTIGSLASAGSTGYNALNSATGGALSNLFKNLFKDNSIGTNIPGSGQTVQAIDTSGGNYGNPVTGTGAGGGAGLGQVLGTDGNIYNDPTYGTGSVGGSDNGGDYSVGV
jgi:hypothetical protein